MITDISSSTNLRCGVPPWLTRKGVLHHANYLQSQRYRDPGRSLYSRGVSKLLDDSPSLQADLRTASRLLRTLLGKIDAAAAKAGEIAKLLANMRIEIEE